MDLAQSLPIMTKLTLGEGSVVGGYRLGGMLGKGGMGFVFLAEQMSIGRQVALKVLHPNRLGSPQRVEQFLREARTAARLQHQNLVTIHEAGVDVDNGLAFYSMDYIHGRTLRTLLNQFGAMDEDRAVAIMRQACQGLAKAHAAGIVHRDIKPENILVDNSGRAMITDLGLACEQVPVTPGAGNRRLLSIVGTPGYAAPEQARVPESATCASDVFSLGCTLYCMVTGRDPFDGATVIDLIANVLTIEPDIPDTLSGSMADIIDACLHKDPAERPNNAAALDVLLADWHPGPSQDDSQSITRRRRRVPRRRR